MPGKHLAVEISTGAVRFSKLNGSFVNNTHEFEFVDRQDYRYKEQLKQFIEEAGVKEIDFETFSVSWAGNQSTIVPISVFNESSAESIFKLCFSDKNNQGDIDYNRIMEQSVANVYSIPLWIKSFFVVNFPRIDIQHSGSFALRGIFGGSTFKLKTFILLQQDFFTLIIVKHNELQFYSSFDYTAVEDIIYYLSFTLQQKEMNPDENEIILSNGPKLTIDMNELENGLHRVFSKSKITVDSNLLASYQEQCA